VAQSLWYAVQVRERMQMQVCAAQHTAARLELLSLEVKSHKLAVRLVVRIKRCIFIFDMRCKRAF
jgi:hypothetical protein